MGPPQHQVMGNRAARRHAQRAALFPALGR
ncbi:MAG: hypothetical protein RIQ46_1374, partial [Pseudomonadota bacterium]